MKWIRTYWPWIIWGIFAICVPLLILWIWGTGTNWVGFWAGYAGAILGSAASLIAFYMTSKQNKGFHGDSIKHNHFENNKTRKEMHEQNRLSVLPYLAFDWKFIYRNDFEGDNISSIDFRSDTFALGTMNQVIGVLNSDKGTIEKQDDQGSYSSVLLLNLKNIGYGAAINCTLACSGKTKRINRPYIQMNGSFCFYAIFPITGGRYTIALEYDDVQRNHYHQEIIIEFVEHDASFVFNSIAFRQSFEN